jgi:hypothetical protein
VLARRATGWRAGAVVPERPASPTRMWLRVLADDVECDRLQGRFD